jgi:hypothetical protein
MADVHLDELRRALGLVHEAAPERRRAWRSFALVAPVSGLFKICLWVATPSVLRNEQAGDAPAPSARSAISADFVPGLSCGAPAARQRLLRGAWFMRFPGAAIEGILSANRADLHWQPGPQWRQAEAQDVLITGDTIRRVEVIRSRTARGLWIETADGEAWFAISRRVASALTAAQ